MECCLRIPAKLDDGGGGIVKLEKAMDRCIEVAKSSQHRTRVGAVLMKKGMIVQEATNLYKTHTIQAKWAKKVGKSKQIHLHAEINSMIRCDDWDTMLVARVDKFDSARLAKPCSICSAFIESVGPKRVLFTDKNGNWEEL